MKPQVFLESAFPAGSFHAAVQLFLRDRQDECSPASVFHLFRSLWALGEWLENRPLADVGRGDLRRYVDQLWLRYSAGTIRPVVGDVRQFFRWAKKRKLVRKNPASGLKKPRVRTTRNKAVEERSVRQVAEFLSKQLEHVVCRDAFGVLHAAPASSWGYLDVMALRDLFMLVFLYETGARAGELCRLSSRAMNQSCGTNAMVFEVISVGKTGDRSLRFTMATAELWRVWCLIRPSGCSEYAVVAWSRGGVPRPLVSPTLANVLVRRCRAVGIRPFRPHSLRHAKVTRGRKAVGLELTSRLMEHSSVRVTLGYANIADDELLDAAARTGLSYRLFAGQ